MGPATELRSSSEDWKSVQMAESNIVERLPAPLQQKRLATNVLSVQENIVGTAVEFENCAKLGCNEQCGFQKKPVLHFYMNLT